jgi:actin-like ATPase involved in cell morphogenesis
MKSKNVIDTSGWKNSIGDIWSGLGETLAAKQEAIQEAAKTVVPAGTAALQAGPAALPKTKLEIASDRLSKIGLYVGGGATIDLARKTATATERTAKAVEKMVQKLSGGQQVVPVWGD